MSDGRMLAASPTRRRWANERNARQVVWALVRERMFCAKVMRRSGVAQSWGGAGAAKRWNDLAEPNGMV